MYRICPSQHFNHWPLFTKKSPDFPPHILGREFAFSIAHIYIGSLILDFAQITKNDLDVNLAYTWSITRNNVTPLFTSVLIKNSTEDFDKIVFEGYDDVENSAKKLNE